MKNILTVSILLISIFLTFPANAVCSIQPLDNASYCEYDSEGACCIVEYKEDDMMCYEVWCYWFHECEWIMDSEPLCE